MSQASGDVLQQFLKAEMSRYTSYVKKFPVGKGRLLCHTQSEPREKERATAPQNSALTRSRQLCFSKVLFLTGANQVQRQRMPCDMATGR